MSNIVERLRARQVTNWVHATGQMPRASGKKTDPLCAAAADEIERLRAEVAGLREALQGVLPWVVTQEVACNGLKCREPICMSCDSDSEANAQLACNAYAKASAALAARKGTTPTTPPPSPSPRS